MSETFSAHVMRWRKRLWRWIEPRLLSCWRRLMVRTTVIAITGSVGKTTTKELLAAVLQTAGRTHRTRNNENDVHGVPKALKALRPWHRFAVIEIGTGQPGMVERSARLVRPDIAIVLSVARTHTNVFATLEETAREKASLLTHLAPKGIAILNADDSHVARMRPPGQQRILWFGASSDADIRVTAVAGRWPERLVVDVDAAGEQLQIKTQLVGTHWAPSILAAVAAGRICHVTLPDAEQAMSTMAPFMARMQPVELPGGAIAIRDEGNGSPDTLAAMLAVMRDARARRRVLVFSDLSDSRQTPRRRLRAFGRIAAGVCEHAVFIGVHSHHAAQGAREGGMSTADCHAFIGLVDAAEHLRRQLVEGDVVFIKGRATDHLSRLLFGQFGPIDCWKRSCPIRRPCDLCQHLGARRGLVAARVSAAHEIVPPPSVA
jgi:UDP-N-acetylmuramoyl-tripeptide--D-alanyl-D-alanine ligase